jgi:dTDP-4-dehydrorhamnose 3,5-epimerase
MYKSRIEGVFFFSINKYSDERGWLAELFREDELKVVPKMAYVSMTLPDVVRGPHEHQEQYDYFCFIGPGNFELHLWDNWNGIHEVYEVGEDNPLAVVVPPGVIHAYKNISDKPGWVVNGPSELYAGPGKRYPVDEIRHENNQFSEYIIT